MKIKKAFIALAVFAVCISGLWAVGKKESQNSPQFTPIINQRDTLKGLQGVCVFVEHLGPKVENYGLTKQQLQTDVELRLRQNDIKVLSAEEWLSTTGRGYAFLYVNVNVSIREDELVIYNILLQLSQQVFLARDVTKLCGAITWWKVATGSVGLNKIATIREDVKALVAIFSNDYLAVNPKK